jgi:hypothetical protein
MAIINYLQVELMLIGLIDYRKLVMTTAASDNTTMAP